MYDTSQRFRVFTGVFSTGRALAMALIIASSALAQSTTYDFTVDSQHSGLDADIAFTIATEGSLIGNYDATTNPTGTRTKPGLLGAFGPTENVEVPASFGFELEGQPQTTSTGAFRMEVDPTKGFVVLSNFSIDYLGGATVSLPATLILDFDTFRTRTPDSLYFGATIPLPFGELLLSSLTAAQTSEPAAGELQHVADDEYSFTVVPTLVLSGAVDVFGNAIEIPPTPLPLPLMGTLMLAPDAAEISLANPIEIAFDDMPGLELPTLPFDLPTILPPGSMAHVLLNLTLTDIGTSIMGEVALTASGLPIVLGDCDHDLDVDSIDFTVWLECFTGPAVPTPTSCDCGDTNDSGQSDMADFAIWQNNFGN